MATNAKALKALYEALGGEEELVNPSNLDCLNAIAVLGGGEAQETNAAAINEIAENPPSGGGGSSNYSYAVLKYSADVNTPFTLYAPINLSQDGGCSGVSEGLTATPTKQPLAVILYKGKAYIHIDGSVASTTGNIEEDEDGYYYMTGDCEIVLGDGK